MLPYSDPKPQPRRERVKEQAAEEKQRGFALPADAMLWGAIGGLVAGLLAAFVAPLFGLNPTECVMGAMGLGVGMGAALSFKLIVFRIVSALVPGLIGFLLSIFASRGHLDFGTLLMSFIVPAVFVGLLAGATKRNMKGILLGAFAAAFGSLPAYGGFLFLNKMQLPVIPSIIAAGILFGALVSISIGVALRSVKQTLEPTEPAPDNKPAA